MDGETLESPILYIMLSIVLLAGILGFAGSWQWYALNAPHSRDVTQVALMLILLSLCEFTCIYNAVTIAAKNHQKANSIPDTVIEYVDRPIEVYTNKPTTALFPAIKTPHGNAEYVYFLQDVTITHYIKIGHTNNLQRRLSELDQTKASIEVRLIHYIICQNRQETERELHIQYKASRQRGEYFALTDTEIQDLLRITGMKGS